MSGFGTSAPASKNVSEHLPLAIDPDRRGDLFAERRPLLHGDAGSARSLMNSPSRYSPSSRNARRSGGWNTFSAASVSPVVLGLARTRWTDASLPLLIGRMTFSMSPSSKKCSNALSCNGTSSSIWRTGTPRPEESRSGSRGAGAAAATRNRRDAATARCRAPRSQPFLIPPSEPRGAGTRCASLSRG